MTEELYKEDCYLKKFDAEVDKIGKGYVILDRSSFYPQEGGQPTDQGKLLLDNEEVDVQEVRKEKGEIRHYLSSTDGITKGDKVKGVLDWNRRYKFMKLHTGQHLVSAVVLDMYKADTVDSKIHSDYAEVVFRPVSFSEEDLEKIENRCNSLVKEGRGIEVVDMPRDEVEERMEPGRAQLDKIPSSIDPLRVIKIEGLDLCPCGGTHLRDIEEIGGIKVFEKESLSDEREKVKFRTRYTPVQGTIGESREEEFSGQ